MKRKPRNGIAVNWVSKFKMTRKIGLSSVHQDPLQVYTYAQAFPLNLEILESYSSLMTLKTPAKN